MAARRAARESDLIAAIDIGASKSVCLIAHLLPSTDGERAPEIIGVGRQGSAPSHRAGGAHAAETAVRAAVDSAERMAGERIKTAYIGVSGKALNCRRIGVDLEIDDGRITEEDVADCLKQGSGAAAPEGCSALHALPIGYSVDGESVGDEPAGLAGGLLSARLLGVGARESHLINLEALLERCGLRAAEFLAAPLAAAESVLLEDEKDLGVILVDLGAGSTGYAVYEGGAISDCGGVSLGGAHITRDIAQLFGAPLREAERIKTLYGAALIGAGDEHKLVDLPQLGAGGDITRVSRSELSAVITPRLEEIFELTAKRLPSDAKARHGVRRVVLTGGGSLLVGARETAERVLGMKARLGRPTSIAGAPDAATAPQFSVCAGLIQLAAQLKKQRTEHGVSREQMRAVAGGVFTGVGRWLRDNF